MSAASAARRVRSSSPLGLERWLFVMNAKHTLSLNWFGENIQKMSFAGLVRDAAGFIGIVKREYIRIKVFGF